MFTETLLAFITALFRDYRAYFEIRMLVLVFVSFSMMRLDSVYADWSVICGLASINAVPFCPRKHNSFTLSC